MDIEKVKTTRRAPLRRHSGKARRKNIMADTVMFSLRMDKETKKKCEKIYSELGVSLSAAINVFLHQSVYAGGFPFDVRLDASTRDKVAAMAEEKKTAEEK